MFSQTKVVSNLAQPPSWYANDPPQASDCSSPSCHGGGVTTFDTTKFDLKMGLTQAGLASVVSGVTTYVPGTTYFMSVSATGPSASYGFELTAQYDSTDAGTLVDTFALLTGSTTTSLQSVHKQGTTTYTNKSYYVGHRNANSTNSWTFKWTAPTVYSGPIKIYYAGNYANGNGNADAGDHIYNALKIINVAGPNTAINEIGNKLDKLSAFPSLMNDHLTIAFDLKESSMVNISMMTITGQIVKNMADESMGQGAFQRTFNMNGVAPGLYLVKVQIGNDFAISKVVKE